QPPSQQQGQQQRQQQRQQRQQQQPLKEYVTTFQRKLFIDTISSYL
ncbi:unnamed protein product, partial [Rotaria socialis]